MNTAIGTSPFVHLHVHSEFSLADGLVRLTPLVAELQQLRQPAIALTDLSNLYGAVKFYRACLQGGVKPIIGTDIWVENPDIEDAVDRLVLLCQNGQGYQNLSRLLSEAYLGDRKNNRVVFSWEQFCTHQGGLIVLFDEQEGPLARAMNSVTPGREQAVVERYQKVFDDRVYLAISRIGRPEEEGYIDRAVGLAEEMALPLVANNRVQFVYPSDFDAHEIRVCIHQGKVVDDVRRSRLFTPQQYLKSTEEMVLLFADIPQAIHNTTQVAKRCNLFLDFNEDHLPDYPGAKDQSPACVLREQTEKGLCQRLGVSQLIDQHGGPSVDPQYLERMELELQVIEQMGYPGYFLIVADFIHWSRQHGIPVGPGRGSGAGSLVAWATGITEIDPLPFGLLFERFLNPERVSLPDFDIDFCVDGRDRVIEYVAERYGHDQVAQIITFGTMAAKAVVRDVGRVMGFPYGAVDQVAKLIPFEIGMTLTKALSEEETLMERYQQEEDIQRLIDMAMQLEGVTRNVGKHAGGVVIAPRALTHYTPLYADEPSGQAITQFDKDDLESIGLVKFDFLGLRTLTIIESAVQFANQQRARSRLSAIDITEIPLDDEATFKLIQAGKTRAIFQLESTGMRDLVIRLKPDCFDDLVALVALFRPGPLQSGMVDDFINRKHGREPIRYPHDDIESILKTTYGVILYQEQVMQIAQVLAGYTLGGADLLRRAMGKKKPEEMEKQRDLFIDGATRRGVKSQTAKTIFDLMEKFAGYGFNKSHSAAYALIAYQTAWLKAHYPAAHMAATLSAELAQTDKVVPLLADCAAMELTVLPPDINRCDYGFKPLSETEILYGMGAIKGVGKGVVERIVTERNRVGKFKDLIDFCSYVGARTVSKRVLEVLIKSGAMDCLGEDRAVLMHKVPETIQVADQRSKNERMGQFDLFGEVEVPGKSDADQPVVPWTDEQRLSAEKETLGLYLSGHPYSRFAGELKWAETEVATLDLTTPKMALFGGLVIARKMRNTRRGKLFIVTLDNRIEQVEMVVYAEKYKEFMSVLTLDEVLVARGEFSLRQQPNFQSEGSVGEYRMRMETVYTVDQVRAQFLRGITIKVDEKAFRRQAIHSLHQLLEQHKGGAVPLSVAYRRAKGEYGRLVLGNQWRLVPNQSLIDGLGHLFGADNLDFDYDIRSTRSPVETPKRPSYPITGN